MATICRSRCSNGRDRSSRSPAAGRASHRRHVHRRLPGPLRCHRVGGGHASRAAAFQAAAPRAAPRRSTPRRRPVVGDAFRATRAGAGRSVRAADRQACRGPRHGHDRVPRTPPPRGASGGTSARVEDYVRWMRQAGFGSVDCAWKHFTLAVVWAKRRRKNCPARKQRRGSSPCWTPSTWTRRELG